MRQADFVRRHEGEWQAFSALLTRIESRKRLEPAEAEAFAGRYRALCQQVSLATSRAYGRELCESLQQLALRGHRVLHARRRWLGRSVVDLLVHDYPRVVRTHARFVLVSTLAFLGTMVVLMAITYADRGFVTYILPAEQVAEFEAMYTPTGADRVGPERGASDDLMAFAFYLRNNTGIGFRTFAGGILFCIGTLFFLVFNGLHIGAIAGYLSHGPTAEPFWSFVSGHSAFELTAIVLSGAAGLRLGYALIAPGQATRRRALRDAARDGVRIMAGAALLFFLAAVVEGFWSAITGIPANTKYLVGITLWVLTLGWLALGGRREVDER